MFSLSSQDMGRTLVFMFDPLPEIPDDDVDSFVRLSDAARATFERLAGLQLPAGGQRTEGECRCPDTRPQMAYSGQKS
jgi:hypothetical protein